MGPTLEIRPIPGYEGRYSARSDGAIISHPKRGVHEDKALGQRVLEGKYLYVSLCKDGKPIGHRSHRLICLAFHGPPPRPDDEVHHKNHIKTDNRPENLEWTTGLDNKRRAVEAGKYRGKRGETNWTAKLTEKDVQAIRSSWPTMSMGQLAEAYGVVQPTIFKVIHRQRWKHVA